LVFYTKEIDMNIVLIRGNLARDPDLRIVGERQTSVVNFTVATSREFTRADGTQDKVATFVVCEAWDSGAEAIASTLKKGDFVMIEGSLRNDSWEKDGVKHSTLKVRVNNFAPIAKIKKNSAPSTAAENIEETVAF
jgi:single-strand DNA-binding protein